MRTGANPAYRWNRPARPLPSRGDFDPGGWDLDAQCAWKHFGGRTLDHAYGVFSSNPLRHQEDFMWMGGVAFEYYFPVVDRYLRAAPLKCTTEGWEAATALGSSMAFQLGSAGASRVLLHEIDALASLVLADPARFEPDPRDQRRLEAAWNRVRTAVALQIRTGRPIHPDP